MPKDWTICCRIRQYARGSDKVLKNWMICQKSEQHAKSFKDITDEWMMSSGLYRGNFGLICVSIRWK